MSHAGALHFSVERAFAWLPQCRRLRVHDDTRADIYEVFLSLGVRADRLACAAEALGNWLAKPP